MGRGLPSSCVQAQKCSEEHLSLAGCHGPVSSRRERWACCRKDVGLTGYLELQLQSELRTGPRSKAGPAAVRLLFLSPQRAGCSPDGSDTRLPVFARDSKFGRNRTYFEREVMSLNSSSYFMEPWMDSGVSNSNVCVTYPEGLLKHRFLGPTTRASNSAGLGWGLRLCIAKMLPVVADAANPTPTVSGTV